MEDDRIKRFRMGRAGVVKPTPNNLVVPLLARYNIPPSRIVGYAYEGSEFQELDANKYKDYTAAFFGVSADEGLPTRFIFGREGEKTLDVWHILIYWGGIYDACIEATWSAVIHDFIITMRLGRLDTLDPEVASHLVDGLALLNWVQERLAKKTYRADAESKTKVLKLDLLKAAADIGRKPKKPRQRSGLNIQPLAERAGYGKQTIYDLLEAEPEFKRELYAAFYASRESQSDS